MGHGSGQGDPGTKTGTPGSREQKVAGSAKGGEHVMGRHLALLALGSAALPTLEETGPGSTLNSP